MFFGALSEELGQNGFLCILVVKIVITRDEITRSMIFDGKIGVFWSFSRELTTNQDQTLRMVVAPLAHYNTFEYWANNLARAITKSS